MPNPIPLPNWEQRLEEAQQETEKARKRYQKASLMMAELQLELDIATAKLRRAIGEEAEAEKQREAQILQRLAKENEGS